MPYGYDVKKPNDFNILGGCTPIFQFLSKHEFAGYPNNQINGNINVNDNYTDGAPAACTFSDSITTITAVAHGLETGDYTKFAGSPLPSNIDGNKFYYVTKLTDDTFNIRLYPWYPVIQPAEVGTTTTFFKRGLTNFCITARPGFWYVLERMIVTVRDTLNFDSGGYGDQATPLNPGINLINGLVENGEVSEFNITLGVPIKQNPDWAVYCYDHTLFSYGQGPNQTATRWTFSKMGRPVILDGDKYEFACIRVQEDLSFLLAQYFQIQGMIIPKSQPGV